MTKGNRSPTSVKWLLILATFVGLVTTSEAAELFAVSHGAGREIFRYRIVGPGDMPTAPDHIITDPRFDFLYSVAFGPDGQLFVSNWKGGVGSFPRFLSPGGNPVPNGAITSPALSVPFFAAFRDKEFFVAQRENILRFVFDADGNATLSGTISGYMDRRGVAFRPESGELFVSQVAPVNTIQRYRFDAAGNAIPNGVIRGGGLNNPTDMVFSSRGELFVANVDANTVSRFVFDESGNAMPNGQITGSALKGPVGLAFSPWGELFVSNYVVGGISRWLFDASFNAIPNGSFATPARIVDIAFLPTDLSCEGTLPKLSALISSKTGTQEARTWMITLSNKSYCPAQKAQIDGLKLTQTYGVACTPVISSPASFPLKLGDIAAGGKASGAVTINFSGCDAAARFSARITYSANDGAVKGAKTLNNQFR